MILFYSFSQDAVPRSRVWMAEPTHDDVCIGGQTPPFQPGEPPSADAGDLMRESEPSSDASEPDHVPSMTGRAERRCQLGRGWWWGPAAVLGMLALAVVYMAGGVDGRGMHDRWQSPHMIHSIGHAAAERAMTVFVVAWVFWVAAAIGSFLNVVAYRTPAGRPLGGRSHCPHCNAQLSWRDNVPVLGWLFLRGRCRTCDQPISTRYPIVELMVSLTLGCVILSRLANVPLPHDVQAAWTRRWFGDVRPVAIGLLGLHATGVAWLWAMALIRFDGHRLPAVLRWGPVGLALAILVVPPWGVVTWRQLAGGRVAVPITAGGHVEVLLRILTAAVMAILLGRSLSRSLAPTADLKLNPLGKGTWRLVDSIAIFAVITILIGWQEAIGVVVVASIIAAAGRFQRGSSRRFHRESFDRDDPLAVLGIVLPMVCSVHLCLWDFLHRQTWWPSDHSAPPVVLVWGGLALAIPLWLKPRPRVAKPLPGDAIEPISEPEMTDSMEVRDA